MTHPADDDDERNAKLILLRLNDCLRSLLDVVQLYHQQHEHCGPETQVKLLQKQASLLQSLDDILKSFCSILPPEQVSRAMTPLVEYVSLPLLAIIKGTPMEWNNNNNNNNAHRILQSCKWKTVQLAALIYHTYIVPSREVSVGLSTSETTTVMTTMTQAVKVVVACAFALPTGQDLEAQAADDDSNNNNNNNNNNTTTVTAARLDKGMDCLVGLLELITVTSSAYEYVPLKSSQTLPLKDNLLFFAEQLSRAMNGAILGRIVDTCVAILKTSKSLKWTTSVLIAANQTIQALLNSVPLSSVWKRFLPGCFGGLYRSLLESLQATTVSSKVPLQTTATMTLLLEKSLVEASGSETNTKNRTSQPIITKTPDQALNGVLASLQKLTIQANQQNYTSNDDEAEEEEKTASNNKKIVPAAAILDNGVEESKESVFFQQVRTRLSKPLIVLVRQLCVSRTASVRLRALELYTLLLLKTEHCWVDDDNHLQKTSSDIIKAVVESCLLLTNDSDENVSAAAQKLIQTYGKTSTGETAVEMIQALMEELPVLAQSQRKGDILTKLKLLSAYLSMNLSSKQLYASLCLNGSSDAIRNTFSTIVDLDLELFDSSTVTSANLITSFDDAHRPHGPRSRYFDKEIQTAASDCLNRLGQALGPKYAALLVDACIADVYESLTARVERRVSLTGASQTLWLHEWVGVLVAAKELVKGAFGQGVASPGKEASKRTRILEEMVASVLPILASSPLFDLPSSNRLQDEMMLGNELSVGVTASALRGNAAFTFVLLELIESLFALLGISGNRFMPTTLFAILEKASWLSSPSVHDLAIHVLDQMASASGVVGRKELALANMSTLIGAMNAQLRVPGGRMISSKHKLDRNVLFVTMASSALLKLLCSGERAIAEGIPTDTSILARLQDLFGNLIDRFDHQATKVSESVGEPLIFLDLFDSLVGYFVFTNRIHDLEWGVVEASDSTIDDKSWMKLLRPFEKNPTDDLEPANGFALHRTIKERNNSQSANDESDGPDTSVLSSQIRLVSDILSRSCYLLSHPSLKVQITSCSTIIRCFQFLGWVSRHVPDQHDNGPSTAILRQVHSHWPSISARLKAMSSAVTLVNSSDSGSSLLLVPSNAFPVSLPSFANQNKANLGEQRVFLSMLFRLVGILCQSADDFMARHYRTDVYPCIGKVIGLFVSGGPSFKRLNRNLQVEQSLVKTQHHQQQRLVESETSLLISIMTCVSRIYSNRPLGLLVSNLIPSTGTMLLPFLETSDDMVYQVCMDTLQCLLRIDCDSLYRHLMALGNQRLPTCPQYLQIQTSGGKQQDETLPSSSAAKFVLLDKHASKMQPGGESRLVAAAKNLVDFIHSLPEQEFE